MMRFSALPLGNEFEYKTLNLIKTNYNRGYYFQNRQKIYIRIPKHAEINVGKIKW